MRKPLGVGCGKGRGRDDSAAGSNQEELVVLWMMVLKVEGKKRECLVANILITEV
ncbi:Hypothetical predicted protein [Olea europaea subsp. europaea]|nr:Hypothetical predicted protein [Olea europaea subsp. europaea]